MGKVKEKMLMDEYDVGTTKEYDHAFPMTQATLFEEMAYNGFKVTEYPLKNALGQDGNGVTAGNNFCSPSMTGTTSSAASKPETLILNGQAKPSITTKEKKVKAGQFTNAQNLEHQKKMQEALIKMHAFFIPEEEVPF